MENVELKMENRVSSSDSPYTNLVCFHLSVKQRAENIVTPLAQRSRRRRPPRPQFSDCARPCERLIHFHQPLRKSRTGPKTEKGLIGLIRGDLNVLDRLADRIAQDPGRFCESQISRTEQAASASTAPFRLE